MVKLMNPSDKEFLNKLAEAIESNLEHGKLQITVELSEVVIERLREIAGGMS